MNTVSGPKKQHPWKPGTMVKTIGKDIPLFRSPRRIGDLSFIMQIPPGEWVMYVDCEHDRMYKVIYGEHIGWTYFDAVISAKGTE